MTLDAIEADRWIFEGGHSATYAQRLDRADTLIWLDMPLGLRLRRVLWRTVRDYGRSRPDMPDGCPEQFSLEFLGFIWRTRQSSRDRLRAVYDGAPTSKVTYHFTAPPQVRAFLSDLRGALAVGNLGIPHR